MEKIAITSDTIQLDQFLKWAGIIETGGQVRLLIEEGLITVNQQVVTERRKKLRPGDMVEIRGNGSWCLTGA